MAKTEIKIISDFPWQNGESQNREIFEISDKTVHIWPFFIPSLRGKLAFFLDYLNDEERSRAERYRLEADKNRFILGRGLLRLILSFYLEGLWGGDIKPFQPEKYGNNRKNNNSKRDLLLPRNLPIISPKDGKPYLDLTGFSNKKMLFDFNISHSGDFILAGVAQGINIGVDIEKIRQDIDFLAIANRFFNEEEREFLDNFKDDNEKRAVFYRVWSLKEARIKCQGSKMFNHLDEKVPLSKDSFRALGNNLWIGKESGFYYIPLEIVAGYSSAIVIDDYSLF